VVHQIGEFQLGCEYCNKRFFFNGRKEKASEEEAVLLTKVCWLFFFLLCVYNYFESDCSVTPVIIWLVTVGWLATCCLQRTGVTETKTLITQTLIGRKNGQRSSQLAHQNQTYRSVIVCLPQSSFLLCSSVARLNVKRKVREIQYL